MNRKLWLKVADWVVIVWFWNRIVCFHNPEMQSGVTVIFSDRYCICRKSVVVLISFLIINGVIVEGLIRGPDHTTKQFRCSKNEKSSLVIRWAFAHSTIYIFRFVTGLHTDWSKLKERVRLFLSTFRVFPQKESVMSGARSHTIASIVNKTIIVSTHPLCNHWRVHGKINAPPTELRCWSTKKPAALLLLFENKRRRSKINRLRANLEGISEGAPRPPASRHNLALSLLAGRPTSRPFWSAPPAFSLIISHNSMDLSCFWAECATRENQTRLARRHRRLNSACLPFNKPTMTIFEKETFTRFLISLPKWIHPHNLTNAPLSWWSG